MDTNMIAISVPTHAAIRFYSDERRKIEIISTKDIENYNGENCFNEPYYVKRYDNQNNNFHLSPAEVLSVGSEEHLLNKKGRFKFLKTRRSDALQQLRLKIKEKQKTSTKNIKIMKQKLKKLGKAHNGKQQLEKFLSKRKCLNPLSDNDEDTTDHSTHEISPQPGFSNETQYKKCTKSSHNVEDLPSEDENDQSVKKRQNLERTKTSPPCRSRHSEDEISPQPGLSNETQSKKCTKSSHNVEDLPSEDENDQSVMLQKNRQNLERTKTNPPCRHSEDESDKENNESEITETPRLRRFRRNKVYRLKLQDAPYDSDEEAANEYDNSMRPHTRDVNPEGKQLYDIEGDEIYIGYGKMINLAFWEYMKHRGHWVFLRELLEILWTREALVNRCFKTSRITTELENRSPRKRFTPEKYRTLRRLFKDYLNKTYGHTTKKAKIIRDLNKHIGYKIRDLRKSLYKVT